jgi:hypothetical protein
MASFNLAPFKPSPPRPSSPSAGTGFARSSVAKTQLRSHPQAKMVLNSVNKTALHPGGVEYVLQSTAKDVEILFSADHPENTPT